MITLPDNALVSLWSLWLELPIGLIKFREHALNAYRLSHQGINYPELNKLINRSPKWDNYKYKRYSERFVSLDNGAWKADLKTAYARSTIISQILLEYNTHNAVLLKSSSISLLVDSAWNRSCVIYIPEHYKQEEPIDIAALCLDKHHEHDNNTLHINKIILVVGKGAHVEFIYKVDTVATATITHITGILEQDAQVAFVSNTALNITSKDADSKNINFQVKIDSQQVDKNSCFNNSCFSEFNWYLKQNAYLNITDISCPQALCYSASYYNLIEEYAHIEHITYKALSLQEESLLVTGQFHVAAHTKSSVIVKTALQDEARSFYKSIINIDNEAQKSSAQQKHEALMLNDSVQNCAIPSLEVKADDVQCSHGSAAGSINAEELWYLCSRGLELSYAKRLIIEGFFSNANKNLSQESLTILVNQVCA